MATNLVANPSGASLTGWTKTGGTFQQTADGVRWFGSGAHTLSVQAVGPSNGSYYKLMGVQIRRNTNFTNTLSMMLSAAAGYRANYDRIPYTDLPVGVFQHFPVSGRCFFNDGGFGGGLFMVLTNASGAYDITIKNVGIYVSTDVPAGAVIDSNDATFSVTQASNSLVSSFAKVDGNEAVDFLTWSWGDGTTSTTGDAAGASSKHNVSHTYAAAGVYTVRLTSKNTVGRTTTTFEDPDGAFSQTTFTEQSVTVPVGTFDAEYTYSANYLTVDVDGGSSVAPSLSPVQTYTWNWGDGSPTSTGQYQSHTYTSTGTYNIALTIANTTVARSNTETKSITVVAPPNPSNYFTTTKDLLSVTFQPSISGGTYSWSFGDSATSTSYTPTHVYALPGTYAVTLTVNGSLTTTQNVTVSETYTPIDLNDSIRLEVAVPHASGDIYNRLENPNGEFGGYGWVTPVTNSTIIGSGTSNTPVDKGFAGWKLVYSSSGTSSQTFYSESVPVIAGQYAGAGFVGLYVDGYFRVSVEAYNAAGTLLGTGTSTGYQTALGTLARTTPYLLPAGTTKARLKIIFTSDTGSGVPTVGKLLLLSRMVLATAATSTPLTTLTYTESENWVNIIGPTHSIDINREALNLGTLSATVLDADLDPSVGDTIRPGQPVRVRVLSADDEGSTIVETIYAGTLTEANVSYEQAKFPGEENKTNISLSAVDNISTLASRNQPNGVQLISSLPHILEDMGTPYIINGSSNQVPTATIVSVNDNASALDQVAITRDTNMGYAYVNRNNVLVANDPAHMSSTSVSIIDEKWYVDYDATFSTKDCINAVTIKWLRYDSSTAGETVEITYGPYEDAASIAEWGYRPATFTLQGVENPTAIAAFANSVIAANGVPEVRVNSVDIPIRHAEDLNTGKALLDLYDLVTIVNARTGVNEQSRVTGIKHSITPLRWDMQLEFSMDGAVASPQVVASPPVAVVVPTVTIPFASRYKSAAQTVATATTTSIALDGATALDGITFSTDTFTIVTGGLYFIQAAVGYSSGATSGRGECSIYKGSTQVASTQNMFATGETLGASIAHIIRLVAGDTILMKTYQTSGATRNIRTGAQFTFMDITRLGD